MTPSPADDVVAALAEARSEPVVLRVTVRLAEELLDHAESELRIWPEGCAYTEDLAAFAERLRAALRDAREGR